MKIRNFWGTQGNCHMERKCVLKGSKYGHTQGFEGHGFISGSPFVRSSSDRTATEGGEKKTLTHCS